MSCLSIKEEMTHVNKYKWRITMKREDQIEIAKKFRKLYEGELFFLPNAWKGGSAKIFEKQGFLAIGTTSTGIAYSLGHEDGEKIKFNDTKKLNQIGLNRLSSSSAPVRTTLNKLINISTDFNNGECKSMLLHNFSYAAANKYFRER